MPGPSPTREWNSAEYHRLSGPQVAWGKKVLARISLRGDESLLDAGCGTGRLTSDLLRALPRGRVVALDISQNMLRSARDHLRPQFGDSALMVAADMLALPFDSVFDGVVSTAAFHWVLDHDRLFHALFRALRSGGWLEAQYGGQRNLARLHQRMSALAASPEFRPWLGGFPEPWLFQDAEAAAATLRRAGFVDVRTNLEAAPTLFEDRESFIDFVRTVIARIHLERLHDTALGDQYVARLADQAAQDAPPFLLDYWRLNLSARKP